MKRYIGVLCAIIIFSTLANATYYSGADLVNMWREYKKSEAGLEYSLFKNACYIGYVAGVADACDEIFFSIPKNVTLGQLCEIVGKWLDDNPSLWNYSANSLVIKAISTAFPKN